MRYLLLSGIHPMHQLLTDRNVILKAFVFGEQDIKIVIGM